MTIASTFRGKTSEGTIKTATKGDRTVTTLVMGPDAGANAGLEVRTIADRKANTLTTLTPLPAGTTLPPAITGVWTPRASRRWRSSLTSRTWAA